MKLRCAICKKEPAPEAVTCRCGGPIEVIYDYDKIHPVFPGVSIWRFAPLLPTKGPQLTMHEAWTPLFESKKIAPKLGADLWWKKRL